MKRKPTVAGSWYSNNKKELKNDIEELFKNKEFGPGEIPLSLNQESRTIIGGVSPHAGYYYSGNCAAHTYFNLFKEKIPDTVIVLGTDHVGYDKIGTMEEGIWETPLGDLPIDNELSKLIVDNSDIIYSDYKAFIGYPFSQEHNIEIQLPFIKYCSQERDICIVPIKYSIIKYKKFNSFNELDQAATDIANAIKQINKDVVIVASTDFSHEPVRNQKQLAEMKDKDGEVINGFLELNPQATFKAALSTSVCGPQTITSLILICRKLNATKAKKVKYFTSYDRRNRFGPTTVGYFSGIINK